MTLTRTLLCSFLFACLPTWHNASYLWAQRQQPTAQDDEDEPGARGRQAFLDLLRNAPPAPMSARRTSSGAPTAPGLTAEYSPITTQERRTQPASLAIVAAASGRVEAQPGVLPHGHASPTVVPTDQRDSLEGSLAAATAPIPIYNTLSAPWNSVYKLLVRFSASGMNYWYSCSASSASSYHLLTAGHCIYNHDIKNDGSNLSGWAQEIWAWPGATDQVNPLGGADFPYGTSKGVYLRTYTAWVNSSDLNWDIATVTLDRRIGERTGWMGREWGINAATLHISGYPMETPYVPAGNVFQYYGVNLNNVIGYTTNRVLLSAYIYGGHSGGPEWRLTDAGNRYIQGVNSTSDRQGYAEGTRYTGTVNSDMTSYFSADASERAPTARPDIIEYVFDTSSKDLLTSSAIPGGQLSVKYNALNAGFADSGTVTFDFYLSKNTIISTSDTFLGSTTIGTLGAWQYYIDTETFTLPTSIAPGQYYVGWITRCAVSEYYNGTTPIVGLNYDDNSAIIAYKPVTISAGVPDLNVTKTHTGSFTRGQVGATYTMSVRNIGLGPTSGTITVSDLLPSGLIATSLSGTGWSCGVSSLTCSRSDALAGGGSYPNITLTVNVGTSAPTSVTNIVVVSGGGESNTANNQANDPTAILSLADLAITKTHTGSFTRGQVGATYTMSVQNIGLGPTSGTVTVSDVLPAGLIATSLSGTGWSCSISSLTCSRSDALPGGGSYPNITLTVNVSSSAPASLTNLASVSGGGEANTGNNGTSDFTTILAVPSGLQFYPVAPCRIADTRSFAGKTGAFGPPSLGAGSSRAFPVLSSSCGIPSTAVAYSLNITAAPKTSYLGWLTAWPTGEPQPVASTLNSWNGTLVANAAIIAAGTAGSISIFVSDAADVFFDINGYFAPATPSGLQFYPVTPCRIADTRSFAGKTGAFGPPSLGAGSSRAFPVLSSSCGIPSTAVAYSLNITAAPKGNYLGWLTAWPTGQPQPVASTLNAWDGTVVANAAIVSAGTAGALNIFVSDAADVFFDINGYFALPTASGLNFYPMSPCRIADTRAFAGITGPLGQPSMMAGSTRAFPVLSSACRIPSTATVYALNLTAVPKSFYLGWLTTWPTGQPQPIVSTLNSWNGLIRANAALVSAGSGGAISIFVSDPSDVFFDINGYFGIGL